MFIIFKEGENKFPIKVWLKSIDDLDKGSLEQAINLSNLPFVHRHVALMPDCHSGFGMPIGGILPTKNVIIPNAVGVDIGCGVAFIHTDVPVAILKTDQGKSVVKQIVNQIMRTVPVGFKHHSHPQPSKTLDQDRDLIIAQDKGLPDIKESYYQIGTLGGGNHFIELQEDDAGLLGIMVHSGSRNFGFKVANYFNRKAKQFNKSISAPVPPEFDLAYLPTNDRLGKAYIQWMNFALDFAQENRTIMMDRIKQVVFTNLRKHLGVKKIEVAMEVNAHHNYASFEEHFGEKVWVHRKGAIRARKQELGIVPGAMGSYSYIVEGLGSRDSFMSCSHGAGRTMGRKEAKRQFSVDEVEQDLVAQGVLAFGKGRRQDVPEEYRKAYKDINEVMDNSADLVKPVLKLKTLAVIKG